MDDGMGKKTKSEAENISTVAASHFFQSEDEKLKFFRARIFLKQKALGIYLPIQDCRNFREISELILGILEIKDSNPRCTLEN